MATPYICSRCLRVATQASRSNGLKHASRSYRSRTAAQNLSIAQETSTLASRTSQAPHQLRRFLSTAPHLRRPAVEPLPTSHTAATPPPQQSASGPPAAQQYSTTTVLNPRTDEETGEAMAVSMTPRATRRLAQIMAKDDNPGLCLRVTVESGGCHGFQYLMSLVDASKVDEAEDSLFVASTPESPVPVGGPWRAAADGRPKVVIDESSLELLKGSKVDYTMELIGSQFKIDNPRASSSCGCGTSFDVKI